MSKRIPIEEMLNHWHAAYKDAEQPWREGYDRKKIYGLLAIRQGLINALENSATEWEPSCIWLQV